MMDMAFALYVGHHIGDYWVQSDHDAQHKGHKGIVGRLACLRHVGTYVLTQAACMGLTAAATGYRWKLEVFLFALLVSGVFHYVADRREYGLMFRLARLLPGKAKFLTLGVPRAPRVIEAWFDCASCEGTGNAPDGRCWDCQGGGKLPSALVIDDNPTLGTGAWALDQSWHIATSVFLPALIMAAIR